MKYLLPLTLLFSIYSSVAIGQMATFEFEDLVCSYKGTYNSKVHSKRQLEDTYRLVQDNFYFSDEGNLDTLNARYQATMKYLDSLQIVDDSYFQLMKDSVRVYLRQTFSLKRAQKLAKVDPSLLLSTVEKGSAAFKYGTALIQGGDSLLVAYKKLVNDQMKNNAIPGYLLEEYQAVMKRIDREDIAFDKVLIYGWWNSANDQVDHVSDRRLMFQNYLKLFLKVNTVDCDEV